MYTCASTLSLEPSFFSEKRTRLIKITVRSLRWIFCNSVQYANKYEFHESLGRFVWVGTVELKFMKNYGYAHRSAWRIYLFVPEHFEKRLIFDVVHRTHK